MTTLIGSALGGIYVLGADKQSTVSKIIDRGDHMLKHKSKIESDKLIIGPNQDYVFGMTGTKHGQYIDFIVASDSGKINFHDAIRKGTLPEHQMANMRYAQQVNNPEAMQNHLLLGIISDDKSGVYHVNWDGRIQQIQHIYAIGSGSESAMNYIDSISPREAIQMSSGSAIRTVHNALQAATSQDIYSSGLDLIVINEDGIDNIGSKITKSIEGVVEKHISSKQTEYDIKQKGSSQQYDLFQ